ncbi:hypothetical protein GLOIN_2v93702 [Rhizophagus irregularis DAOM 181602=DAOM 197198]|uniref:TLDc domain-containing protein n=2 Tax=Rhizophagus irregularis TaxID=588596 RepID=A0A015KYA1_RHIIW|nr:hypothetical protein GLOIN_2v93702 [Rhizophagus irregularis DAOM 181602=DAOM 197198]EXX65011.1 hypothetical protein RirG_137360 [Rhizophagus irregularis DAOM 197198w]POG70959.1 hypothetical protein GLOIN_2v93702 [Rhizophagus irregularis DAOM 181602=DAOM 197198]|eukprot:XP_025177825.1 hypothetical protein GLOIN_2v93702 [Rhizophagus irregularis DAOM 181602=DAOM 197198]
MKNEPFKWNKEDITKIERALYRFIPVIRFYDIEPTDFFYKVYCYKDILPYDLIHDLLEFHIVPNIKPKSNLTPSRKPNFKYQLDSTLIGSNYIPIFASWVDKMDSSYYNRKNIPYDFKLLNRSSQDGNNISSFHKNCVNKGATIWIGKIKNSAQLIGGYNPLDWDQSFSWKTTADSFLFNFTNGKDFSTAKRSYVSMQNMAVYCSPNHGTTMGNLQHYKNSWSYNNSDNGNRYPKIGIPENFEVEDYEVFQVIKK